MQVLTFFLQNLPVHYRKIFKNAYWTMFRSKSLTRCIVKGTVHIRTGHEEPDGEQSYDTTLSFTSATDVGRWLTPRPGRFIPGKDPVPIVQEAGWASGPIWKGAENLAPHRDSIPGLSSP